jgi:hypothetical protein
MKTSVYTRIFIAMLVAFTALAIVSYSRAKPAVCQECPDSDKCDNKKVQSEFIIWESFAKNLLFGAIGGEN